MSPELFKKTQQMMVAAIPHSPAFFATGPVADTCHRNAIQCHRKNR
jgi:hypothetical protein